MVGRTNMDAEVNKITIYWNLDFKMGVFMEKEELRVKFYSESDMTISYYFSRIVNVIENFNSKKKITDINEIIELLEKYILPICENFEDTKTNIQNILNGNAKSIGLFYYIYFFDGEDSAEQYLNKFINQSNLKKKFKGLYHSLENVAKESIDINVSEFSGASTIKFAYLNGIKIEK